MEQPISVIDGINAKAQEKNIPFYIQQLSNYSFDKFNDYEFIDAKFSNGSIDYFNRAINFVQTFCLFYNKNNDSIGYVSIRGYSEIRGTEAVYLNDSIRENGNQIITNPYFVLLIDNFNKFNFMPYISKNMNDTIYQIYIEFYDTIIKTAINMEQTLNSQQFLEVQEERAILINQTRFNEGYEIGYKDGYNAMIDNIISLKETKKQYMIRK